MKRLLTGFVAVAMVLTLSGVAAAPAQAATVAELSAMIAQLQAQLAALGGGSSSAGYQFNADLTLGSSGSDVSALQSWLMSKGYSIPAGATGYFGSQTQAALSAYQAANGISPAAGYFGPITRAKVNAMGGTPGTPTPGTPGTPSPVLEGDAGSVDNYSLQSEFNNEDVGEGEDEVSVMSFEVEADNGSDLEFTSMKVWFENQDTGSSEDFNDYADSVQIWLDGEMVGEADVNDFSADDTSGTESDNSTSDSIDEWEKTISLDNAIVRAGDTSEFVVSVTAVNSIDSSDHDSDDWDVDVTNVRFEDASGAVISEDPALDETAFDFGTFADATNVEMKVSLSNDSPDSQVVNVDDTDETEGVELLTFEIEAEGSDIVLNDIPVLLTVSQPTVTDDVDFVVNNLVLTVNGTDYQEAVSTSAGSAATVTFDDLDITIDEGDTLEFVVSADVNDTQASEFVDGDTLKAELRASEVDAIDADDQEGDSIADADATGTALGDEMAFYDVGIMVTFVSASESVVDGGVNAFDGTGTFVIKYKVEAFDGSIYLSDSATATTAATIPDTTLTSAGVRYLVDGAGTATTANLSTVVTFSTSDGATDSGITNGVELADGETSEFTLTATRTNDNAGDAGLFRVLLKAITWATTDASTQNVYDFDLEDYKTDSVSIN